MRPVLPGLAIACAAVMATPAGAQQGSVQISGSAQAVTGDPLRIAGQNRLEPDFGVSWLQPGDRVGLFQLELRGARRRDRFHPGRLFLGIREMKYRGVTWALEAGDTYFTPAIGEYKFSNLFTPAVTVSGLSASARTEKSSLSVVAGRATAWRNIFGSDPQTLGQNIGAIRATYRPAQPIELSVRASRVRTSNLKEFSYSIAASDQAGGGVRLWLTPSVQVAADASAVLYRREGTTTRERDTSAVVGVNWLHRRGWVQINASRFSPGDFPTLNTPLPDRASAFAAGDYALLPRLRIFAGWEAFKTNLDPDAARLQANPRPETDGTRQFGGVRVRLTARSSLTLRTEAGDRRARRLRNGGGSDSDTGAWTAEWYGATGPLTTSARYSHRKNVDRMNGAGSYSQDDASAQIFVDLTRSTQIFASALATRTALTGGGNTYWQFSGGGQTRFSRDLWFRTEATVARNVDLATQSFVPRESISAGLNGQLTRHTSVGLNVYVDRAPMPFQAGSPWMTRSMLRVTRTMPTGSAYMTGPTALTEAGAGRGTGSVFGSVYADWNASGTFDEGDELLEGIPVRIGAGNMSTTGRDGQFAFLNVPAGTREVGLDTGALPIDFDPPDIAAVAVELGRGDTKRVAFPLTPLGTVLGRVMRDANANGVLDPADEPVATAVLILDAGARSEQARKGRYRFDAVPSGGHAVKLLLESLPEGAVIKGDAEVRTALGRGRMTSEITFLVTIEKRPEIRRVFPPKGGGRPAAGAARPAGATTAPARTAGASKPGARAAVPPARAPRVVIQVAALHDRDNAVALVESLKKAGLPAYISHPGTSDPPLYRVRVGPFTSRAAAQKTALVLEKARGEKLWVLREK
jgi:cell division septation protein DedD